MKEIIYAIVSGAVAGGLVGQLTVIFLTNILTKKRELESWFRSEKYKVFCELLGITSSVVTREEVEDYRTWPDEIRVLSQQVHLLFPGGHAPSKIADTLEKLFQLALRKKLGKVKDDTKWRHEMRDEARKLRESFADTLVS